MITSSFGDLEVIGSIEIFLQVAREVFASPERGILARVRSLNDCHSERSEESLPRQ